MQEVKYERDLNRMDCAGLDLNRAVDDLKPYKFAFLKNARTYQYGRVEPRLGLTQIASLASVLPDIVWSYTSPKVTGASLSSFTIIPTTADATNFYRSLMPTPGGGTTTYPVWALFAMPSGGPWTDFSQQDPTVAPLPIARSANANFAVKDLGESPNFTVDVPWSSQATPIALARGQGVYGASTTSGVGGGSFAGVNPPYTLASGTVTAAPTLYLGTDGIIYMGEIASPNPGGDPNYRTFTAVSAASPKQACPGGHTWNKIMSDDPSFGPVTVVGTNMIAQWPQNGTAWETLAITNTNMVECITSIPSGGGDIAIAVGIGDHPLWGNVSLQDFGMHVSQWFEITPVAGWEAVRPRACFTPNMFNSPDRGCFIVIGGKAGSSTDIMGIPLTSGFTLGTPFLMTYPAVTATTQWTGIASAKGAPGVIIVGTDGGALKLMTNIDDSNPATFNSWVNKTILQAPFP